MRKIYINPYLALLIIAVFGVGATFFIMHAISQVNFTYLATQ